MIPHRVDEASKLYKNGLVEKLIVSGGIGYTNADRKTPEALKMQEYLIKDGIPKNDIIMECQARSSFENIKYSLEIIRENNILNNTRLALITSDFHLKRCMAMMAMAMESNNNFFGFKAKDGIFDIENWQETFAGKKRIYQEALSLCYYVKQGTINDFEVESIKRKRSL